MVSPTRCMEISSGGGRGICIKGRTHNALLDVKPKARAYLDFCYRFFRSEDLAQMNTMTAQRFSCPYFKYNPSKYGLNTVNGSRYRACSGPGFQNVTRVK